VVQGTVGQLLQVPLHWLSFSQIVPVVAHFPLLAGQGTVSEHASPVTEQIFAEGMQSVSVLQNLLGVSLQVGRWQSSSE
jgi:hypothetical protein